MLRGLRKAAGKHARQPDYLPVLQDNVKMMAQHRKLHDFQYHLEQDYDESKGTCRHAEKMREAEDKNAQADAIALRRAQEIAGAALL